MADAGAFGERSVRSQPLRVALISSIEAAPTTAGSIVLYRHLVQNDEIQLVVPQTGGRNIYCLARTLASKLRFVDQRITESTIQLLRGRWFVPSVQDAVLPDLVMTVAHGDLQYAAMDFSHRHNLPLVTMFHDWWPAIAGVHDSLRNRLEMMFRELYRKSTVNLCVSEGMRARLGPHPNAIVLPPIPGVPSTHSDTVTRGDSLTLHYSGNITDFGDMLKNLLIASSKSPDVTIRLRGKSPPWSDDLLEWATKSGALLPFTDRTTLESWFHQAGALLVVQSFDPAQAVAMQTNFPSKLTEYCMYGRPIVIWGPEYGSAVAWGRRTGAACVVSDPSAEAVMKSLQGLARDPVLYEQKCRDARESANTEFSPAWIQREFMNALRRALATVVMH